ncbi:MAG: hypothetical protein E6K18_01435 [Methanobacteriota archaeon]|nr:MAG: hypothetical protein E6K18_01435 [Euryarchaeota archaeon]
MRKAALAAVLVVVGALSVGSTIIPPARAATLYVGGGGPGNHTTIQAAIDAAGPGDTVFVFRGVYPEHVSIAKTIDLVGEGRDLATIDGGGTGAVLSISAPWVNVTGFNLTRASPAYGAAGVAIATADHVRIEGNRIIGNPEGIYAEFSSYTVVRGNEVTRNMYGITMIGGRLGGHDGVLASNVFANNSAKGVDIVGVGNLIITGNTVADNGFRGIDLTWSDNDTVTDNVIERSYYSGLTLDGSRNDTLRRNAFADDGISILGDWTGHTIDTSNTANGKPIYYWQNVAGGTVPPGAGEVILANATRVVVRDQDVSRGDYGVAIADSQEILVENVTASNGQTGVLLHGTHDCRVANGTFSFNEEMGISAVSSLRTTIFANRLSDNFDGIYLETNETVVSRNQVLDSHGTGIVLLGSHNSLTDNVVSGSANATAIGAGGMQNRIERNLITDARDGVYLSQARENLIVNNTFARNTGYGIVFADYNLTHDPWAWNEYDDVYHNNFVGNGVQAYHGGITNWSNGYPLGGNYWSDYTGVDAKSGPNQDQPGSDGIGDTPYLIPAPVIDARFEDRYPLMAPTAPPPPGPPSEPRNLQAVGGNRQVALAWEPPTSDGGAEVTNYTVYRALASGNEVFLVMIGNATTYTDAGLSAGTKYYYRMAARNAAGEGARSNEANASSGPGPNKPPAVTISTPNPGDLVRGRVPVNGTSSDPEGNVVRVEVKIDDGPWLWATGAPEWEYAWDTSLSSDGAHTIRARSYDGMNYSELADVTLTVDNTPPNLRIVSPADGATLHDHVVRIAWNASDTTAGIRGFRVALDDRTPFDVAAALDHVDLSVADGAYRVNVSAIDFAGNYRSVTVTFSVNPGPSPSPGWIAPVVGIVAAVAIGTIALAVFWQRRRKKERTPTNATRDEP